MKSQSWLNKGNFLLISILFLIGFLYWVRGILTSFLIAAIIAYLLYPLVSYLENKRKMSRLGAILMAYLAVAILLMLLFLYIVPVLNQELNQLIRDIPFYAKKAERLINWIQIRYQEQWGVHLNRNFNQEIINRSEFVVVQLIRKTTETLVWLVTSFVNLVIGLILAFYLLRDFDSLKSNIISLLPERKQEQALIFWEEVNGVIEGFIRGQLLVASFMAIFITIGLYLLNIQYALIIGVLAAIVGIIPYLGSIAGALPAVILGLMESPWLALKVIILFLITHQIEGSIVSPKIVGESVGLHPLVVIMALLAGGQILGIWGMLIAVPSTAVGKVLLKHIWNRLPDS